MPGITGREVAAAYVQGAAWGTAASVTHQILIRSTDGLDRKPQLVDDEEFNSAFIGEGEIGDDDPIAQTLSMQARFETIDTWIAAACGSAAAPSVVSSVAADSLIAYQHDITLATELTHFFTLAVDKTQYVQEIPSLRVRGFSMRVGDQGRMMIEFPIVGNKTDYASTVNTNSTVGGATSAPLGNRLFRSNGRFRMNIHTAGALGSGDEVAIIKDANFQYSRPLADDDHVFNQTYIYEPDDDGFADLQIEVTYARMHTVSANSLAIGLAAGRVFKADLYWTGPYINSDTQRSLLLECPALQLASFNGAVTGHNQVRPTAIFRMKAASSAPTGMAFTAPFRATLVNMNSATLI